MVNLLTGSSKGECRRRLNNSGRRNFQTGGMQLGKLRDCQTTGGSNCEQRQEIAPYQHNVKALFTTKDRIFGLTQSVKTT
jgi:hypothetical protein